MTTLDEISTDRRANRAYWNQSVRFVIASIRAEDQAPHGISGHRARLSQAMRTKLTHRANYSFLNLELKP